MANEILGAKSYANVIAESTWGTKPGSPVRVALPVESFGVEIQHQTRQAKPYLGLYQRKHGQRRQSAPQGSIQTSLFGHVDAGASQSLAEYVLEWCFADEAAAYHEASALPSKTIEWAEGPDVSNIEYNGLRVNQATLAADESSGVFSLGIDVIGSGEAALGSAAAIPTDHQELYEFEFEDCVFKLNDGAGGAVAAISIASVQLQIQNSLIVKYNNSHTPTLLLKGDRLLLLTVTLDKNVATYDVFRRQFTAETDFVAQLIVQGLNNDTSTNDTGLAGDIWTIGTIDFPKARYVTHQDQRSRDSIFQQPLQFICLKPDTASNDIAIAWTYDTVKAS